MKAFKNIKGKIKTFSDKQQQQQQKQMGGFVAKLIPFKIPKEVLLAEGQ